MTTSIIEGVVKYNMPQEGGDEDGVHRQMKAVREQSPSQQKGEWKERGLVDSSFKSTPVLIREIFPSTVPSMAPAVAAQAKFSSAI